MPSRRRALGLLTLLLVTATACADGPKRSGDVSVGGAPLATGVARAARYYDEGPSARYNNDSGGIGVVVPLVASFAAASDHDVVVTVSFEYRTSIGDRFVLEVDARRDHEFGPFERIWPAQRTLAPSPVWTTTTATFLLSAVEGGFDYWISPSVNVSDIEGNRATIVTRRVALVVDATPAA